jgi:signal transduction histidine kinase
VLAIVILGISIALQFIAAAFALRLIRITGRWRAWSFIAIALTLMGVRRSITFYRVVSGDISLPADVTAELVALSISLLMLLGVLMIGPLLKNMQRAQAESTAEVERLRLVDAIESFTGGFALYDADDKLVICNEEFRKAMNDVEDILKPGLSFEEFHRVRTERGNRKDGIARDEAWIQTRLEQHRNPTGPLERIFDDGTVIQINEFKTHDGGTAIIRFDVTDLSKARLESEKANRIKSEFLANMSHELRTPLNGILGFGQLLENLPEAKLARKPREYVNHILESGYHLLSLINDILDISTIEAEKLELNEDNIAIRSLVDEMLSLIQMQADEKRIRLSSEIDKGVVAIRADERRLKQILINLLSNAVKFTPDGGEVAIRCNLERDNRIRFVVSDTGIGMTKAEMKKALESFGQVEPSLSTKYSGTGLGMPLAKQLVEAHGGTFNLESKRNKGTTVTVLFPAERFIQEHSNQIDR